MRYLICGLGNVGDEYVNTRHNTGFMVLDAFAEASNVVFRDKRFGFIAHVPIGDNTLTLLKPSTFMNLSGNAVRYWLQYEKIPVENLLVIVDDLNLPFGTLRLRSQGSNGGHNGLGNIQQVLGTTQYARLRVGIGNEFTKGTQINYVLGRWSKEEQQTIRSLTSTTNEIITSFCEVGIERTMNKYNTNN